MGWMTEGTSRVHTNTAPSILVTQNDTPVHHPPSRHLTVPHSAKLQKDGSGLGSMRAERPRTDDPALGLV